MSRGGALAPLLLSSLWLAGPACTLSETLGVYEPETTGDSAASATGSAGTDASSGDGGSGDGGSETGTASAGSASASGTSTSSSSSASSDAGGTSTGGMSTGSSWPSTWSESDGSGGGACELDDDDDDCETCVKDQCCQALLLCEEEPGCVCMESCVESGMSFPECTEECEPGPFYAFLSGCRAALCIGECD